ncbi:MAG: amidohydrolase family protein [Polynucleobacter sp.]|jgi:hypothetical protein|nr:amidohydrolase family protein [Polynucleobacter sp.]
MAQAPLCQAPDPVLKKPDFVLPPLSCDCHAHICGPESRYPYSPNRIYTPPDALLPQYEVLLATLGVERAVLVQPSIYGSDNRALLAVLKNNPERYRGVAVVEENISDSELETLHQIGIRGLRCNIVDLAKDKGILPIQMLKKLALRIAPLGWHLEFLMHVNEFPDLNKTFENFPVEIVTSHLGYAKGALEVSNRGFQNWLSLMREGRAWTKLSGPYRTSQALKPPYQDTQVFAEALIKANPERVIWGTDWPHVMVNGFMPNDADLCNLLLQWAPDQSIRKKILVDNPQVLYQFRAHHN